MTDLDRAEKISGLLIDAESHVARLFATRAGDRRLATLRDLLAKARYEAQSLEGEIED